MLQASVIMNPKDTAFEMSITIGSKLFWFKGFP